MRVIIHWMEFIIWRTNLKSWIYLVVKADSVIALTIQNNKIICTRSYFRPGVQKCTLDFPGGRLPEGKSPQEIVPSIIKRELGVSRKYIVNIESLNEKNGS